MLLNMFTAYRLSMFQRFLTQYTPRNKTSSISSLSSSFQLSSTMKKLIDSKQYRNALDIFDQQPELSSDIAINLALKACTKLNDYQRGFNIQRQLSLKSLKNPFIQTSLIHFYMQCHDVDNANHLFSTIVNKSNPIYATMFKGLISNQMPEKVLDLLGDMAIKPDAVTVVTILSACAQLSNDRANEIGRKLLQQMPKDCRNSIYVLNSAIHMLMKFGDVKNAEDIFGLIMKKDIVTYGAMMKGYVDNKIYDKALDLFEQMPLDPNEAILTIAFNACGYLLNDRAKEIGRKLIQQMPKDRRNSNNVINSAINMLMKFGDVKSAEDNFGLIMKKDLVTYGAMIQGYNLNNEPEKSFELFQEMKQHGIVPDEIIFTLLLNACAQIGMSKRCQRIVDQIPPHFQNDRQLQIAMISMWASIGKASSVQKAQQIFDLINEPDVIAYTSMINGFGLNGMGFEAINLYRQMPEYLHNEVTHICVLNACAHAGLLDEARSIFNGITNKTDKIFTTMIDCLSRLFMFDEAQKLMNDYEKSNQPFLPMYMSIMSGLRNQRHSTLSQKLYNRMKHLFPDQEEHLIAGSILLSNIYSSLGDNQQAENIRLNRIKEFGNKFKPGLAWTEVNDELVKFTAHDTSHPRSTEIYAALDGLLPKLIELGYKADASWITRPIRENETVQSILCGHSERLAIGFNLIQQPIPSTIQITKNLRVCGDCHHVTKLIAKIHKCDIIVRDANRIHHFFPNGQCSCLDHF